MGQTYSAGIWIVQPGEEEAFKGAWSDFARATFEHFDGALSVVLLQDSANPRRFISVGAWRDEAAIAAWRSSEEFADAMSRIKPTLESIETGIFSPVFSYGD